MNDVFGLEKEVVVVTGVAGQLGFQYANALLKRGAYVVGIDKVANFRTREIEKNHQNNFRFLCLDITIRKNIQNALECTIEFFGSPNVLINNAALDSNPNSPAQDNGLFEEYSTESWDMVIEANLKSVFLMCQIFGSHMAKNGRGSIVNISSIYAVVSPDQSIYQYRRDRGEIFFKPAAYSASKSGVISLTRYLASYWAKKNVRVNSLTLGGVLNNQEEEFLRAYCGRVPMGRLAHEDEYNGAIIFLSSQASSYMTGSNMVIDGGWTTI
jgi:NAD(P)-dependent dehydrogenase (short-subunit alcohol dehydrogenase family)